MDIGSDRFQPRAKLWTVIGYGLMVLGTAAVFLLIRHYGETLVAPPASGGPSFAGTATRQSDVLLHLMVALAAIILAGQVCARLFVRLGQPPVIGEVVAGILLGPSLLGPEVSALVLPPSVAPFLGVIAQLGVILYMFLVGLELNLGLLRQRSHAPWSPSRTPASSCRFVLGPALALVLYPRLSRAATCPSPVSPCSWASPCRSPPFRCWPAS